MLKKILYTAGVGLGSVMLLTLISTAAGRAQTPAGPPQDAASFVRNFCFDGKVDQMDTDDLVNVYTEKTNSYFNVAIKQIMTKPHDDVPTPSLEDYAKNGGNLCTDTAGREVNDMTCQSLAVCNPKSGTDPGNHPYCVGATLLGVPPVKFANYNWQRLKEIEQLRYGYFCYKAALDLKREAIYDASPQRILAKCDNGSEFRNEDICWLKDDWEKETDPVKKAELEVALAKEVGLLGWGSTGKTAASSLLTAGLADFNNSAAKRIKFIDEEIVRAKNALDQTLDAYSQLKTAWQMHVRYMDVFSDLVKYRDYLVAIRKQTDAFPFRFINASTTKCL